MRAQAAGGEGDNLFYLEHSLLNELDRSGIPYAMLAHFEVSQIGR
jgi:hypothetical protein